MPVLPDSLDLHALPEALPAFRHWFRYPLHDHDFHPVRADTKRNGKLLGYYAAKPLYGKLDAQGRVDRSAGLNGEVIAVFVPSPARSWKRARLIRTRMPRERVRRVDGRRNWMEIRRVAEQAIVKCLANG